MPSLPSPAAALAGSARAAAAHLGRKRTIAWGAALAALAGVLCFVPLANVLGYESSAATAVAASLAFAHLGRVHAQAARERGVLRAFGEAIGAHLALLAVPLAILSANALRVRNCDLGEGLLWYAALPVPSGACATAAGVFWGFSVRRPTRGTALAYATVFASGAWALWRLWSDPPVFAYDAFFGYVPGPLYDERVSLGRAFWAYRALNLAVAAAALLGLARRWRPAAVAAAGAAALWLGGGDLGFRVTRADLHRALPGRVRTPDLIVRHARGRGEAARAFARDAEFRLAQVREALSVDADGPIVAYLFPSAASKQRWIGAGATNLAKPWRRELFVQEEGVPHPVVKHELAHVVAGAAGDPVLRVSARWRAWPPLPSFNVGLIEGVASAVGDLADDRLSLDEEAAALRRVGKAPALARLLSAGFFAESPARGYTYAGSYLRFLFRRHGAAWVLARYRDAHVAGGGADARDWEAYLDGLAVPEERVQALRERFRRPALVRRVCAREIAQLRGRAAALARKGRHGEAAEVARAMAGFDAAEPEHLVSLAGHAAEAGRAAEARTAEDAALAHPRATSSLRHRIWMDRADRAWNAGDRAGARAAYLRGAREPDGEPAARLVAARLSALDRAAHEDRLRRLLGAGEERLDEALRVLWLRDLVAEAPEQGFFAYLLGRALVQHGLYLQALPYLERAGRLGAGPGAPAGAPDEAFAREALRLTAHAAWRAGDLDRLAAAAERLGAMAVTQGDREEAADWQARADWERGPGREIVDALR